jgi:hypothetical protein
MFIVIGTPTYLNEIQQWEKADREAAEKLPYHLRENPFVGKPLSYKFLREKRINEKRIYYLIYEDLHLVLLVATSGKKDQQITIDYIKDYLKDFRIFAENIIKQGV